LRLLMITSEGGIAAKMLIDLMGEASRPTRAGKKRKGSKGSQARQSLEGASLLGGNF